MSSTIAILCCHNFHREVCAAIAAEGWTDVAAIGFPARCGRPPLAWDELRALLPADCGHLIVIGRACLGGLAAAPAGFPETHLLRQQQCFHLVANPAEVDQAITEGAYLLTPDWLADWPGRLRDMGFEPDSAGEFFRDFASKLVLLDTGIEPDAVTRLADLARCVALPATRLAVGLEHLRLVLARAVLDVRLGEEHTRRQQEAKHHRRELADHISAVDLLSRLAGTQDEAEVLRTIEDIFRMLFAPAAWHYLRVEGTPLDLAGVPAELRESFADCAGPWIWTPSGRGFLLRIARADQTLGMVAVDGLAFPEFRERYLNLALAISGVCALAIDNARTHKRLVEAEKMASLGVLVAGVAHEVNTPLGVGLAAVSTLQRQSAEIARNFAERKMTQSSLQTYLEAVGSEAALIRGNLDRIGRLVDAFRQVAVSGTDPARRRVRVRAAIEDVVATLGDRLASGNVAVELECDPALEIESSPDDWTTIFSNLLVNSLNHGFRDRQQGHIRIEAHADESRLHIDYDDDGVGMTAESRRRIFDPFYTTDPRHGMGLGMHLAYNLVVQRLHGGIRCTSEPGQGCQFHIEVPR